MSYEFSLVLFTTLTQFAVGLAVFSAWKNHPCTRTSNEKNINRSDSRRKDWEAVFILASVGLVASLFHLAQPLRAFEALSHLGNSWLSREALLFTIFTALALLNVYKENRILAVVTAFTGVAGIVAQGFTYAPAAMPAINNAAPLLLFFLSSLALGAAAGQLNGSQTFTTILATACVCLVVILLLIPCLWTSGNAVMQATAELWLQSLMFWLGVLLILTTFFLSIRSSQYKVTPLIILFCGIFLTRLVFFGGTVHTAANLGMPY